MSDLKPGDTVQIKSGGPLMTVIKATATEATCLWYSEQAGDVKTATVPAVALDRVDLADDEDDAFDED
jgi:uncharacterized protein YodC (DUF2158 family)